MIKKIFQAAVLVSSIINSMQTPYVYSPRDTARYASQYPLHKAVLSESVETIAEVLRTNPTAINAHDDRQQTPLHLAVTCGGGRPNHKIINLLLDGNADINQPSKKYAYERYSDQITPLFAALNFGNREKSCIPLLEHKADIETRDTNGFTPLLYASHWGHERSVETLLQHNADIEATDPRGNTAVILAAASPTRGNFESLVTLIKAKANLDHRNNSGHTALNRSCVDNRSLLLQALTKKHGNNIPLNDLYPRITTITPHPGYPEVVAAEALHRAIQAHDVGHVRQLLHNIPAYACRLTYYHHDGHNKPLSGAILENNEEIANLLLEHEQVRKDARLYVERPVYQVDCYKIGVLPTPLYFAAQRSASPALMQRLLALEAPRRLEYIQTQLTKHHFIDPVTFYYAIDAGDLRAVELLLQNREPKNINRSYRTATGIKLFGGKTPLELATKRGNQEIVDLLIMHGATVRPAPKPKQTKNKIAQAKSALAPIPAPATQPEQIQSQPIPTPIVIPTVQPVPVQKDLSHAIKEDYITPSQEKDDALDDGWCKIERCNESDDE